MYHTRYRGTAVPRYLTWYSDSVKSEMYSYVPWQPPVYGFVRCHAPRSARRNATLAYANGVHCHNGQVRSGQVAEAWPKHECVTRVNASSHAPRLCKKVETSHGQSNHGCMQVSASFASSSDAANLRRGAWKERAGGRGTSPGERRILAGAHCQAPRRPS